MRKVPVALGALVVALCFVLPSPLSASSRHRGKPHRTAAARHRPARKAGRHHQSARNRSKRHPVIFQDLSGKVVLDRLAIPPLYGPFLPAEIQDYPQPPCEPIDAVVEVRIHEPDPDTPETPSDGLAEGLPEREEAGLARLAASLGSFFRPKSANAVVKPQDVDLTELVSQAFQIPVEGVDAEKLRDSFLSSRGRHRQHLAIDIGAPRGTPVLATIDGEIVRVARERRGGKSIYEKDVTGQYLLFYCHLSRYAENLAAGTKVKKGEVIGYVGSTGHVVGGPHLHFSITRLPGDSSSFKQGLAINPYLLFLGAGPRPAPKLP